MGSVGTDIGKPFKEWRKDVHNKYGITIFYDPDLGSTLMEEITPNQRAEFEKRLNAMVSEFPQLKDLHLTLDIVDEQFIELDGKKYKTGGQYNYVGGIDLSKDILDNAKYQENNTEKWYAGVLTTFHPKNTTSYDTITHELAHALTSNIARQMTKNNGDYVKWLQDYGNNVKTVAQTITDNAAKSVGNKFDNLAGHISHYSTYSREEAISEAVMDYMRNKGKSHPYSKAIVSELKKYL